MTYKRMAGDKYELPDIRDRLCCGKPVIVQDSTGDWACQNEECENYHGYQAAFESGMIKFKKQIMKDLNP